MFSKPGIGLVLLGLLIASLVQAQPLVNCYRVAFTDKAGTAFSVDAPEQFLSQRSLLRRARQAIPIDESDLPVSEVYRDSLKSLGAVIRYQSRWLNACTVQADSLLAGQIAALDFVKQVQLTKPGLAPKSLQLKWNDERGDSTIDSVQYGSSSDQIGQLNGQFLHQQNFTGSGMQIAVLDAGFLKVNELDAFAALLADSRLLGTRDFVEPGSDVFAGHYHGMSVLSTMAANLPGELVGAAPGASYYLFRTEDAASEYLIEEDYWLAAAEYADSLGADMINSSLGYFQFNDTTTNYDYDDMDGATTWVSRAANMAANKGMLVCASAGNEANNSWRYLVAPSDGDGVLSVGAVDRKGEWASFSSLGPATDGDVKPNVSALGVQTVLVTPDGTIGRRNGTSFASPLVAGLAACLWQANPDVTARQLKTAIEQSASQYLAPDTLLGYGIPDFELADQLLKQGALAVANELSAQSGWKLYPNPVVDWLYLEPESSLRAKNIELKLTNLSGVTIRRQKIYSTQTVFSIYLGSLPAGLYLVHLRSGNEQVSLKVVKNNP
ncbi:S8 family serine peptidase [Mangrovibacterium marinum]|uniref:Putative secreted protein (Por secretion system target) n=1 Tax=Mangrovibacterium marinum TaxID=1639118 RepID=A0A2T5C1L7_9BACT|nr:S8 family serine peptidase [Mangrovibacterium marinum]PTN08514.1 putative secreted protein (Por secretion system target) [Mangrovibacterium marinum]